MNAGKTTFFVLSTLFVLSARAETAWVTDQFEITLRTGPSTANAIERMLGSGTELEVIEQDPDTGYTRVRTTSGIDGWVLSRYLMDEPSSREQLASLRNRLASATEQGSSLTSQLATVSDELDAARRQITAVERENRRLEQELADIKRTAANVLAIDNQNRDLQDRLSSAEFRGDTLEQQNRELAAQSTRYWFLTGALVLFIGMILGIWLPRIRWQRRSRYDRF